MSAQTIYMTCADEGEAERIVKSLLEERLIACGNILQAHKSLYHWQDKIEQASEVAVIMKSTSDKADALKSRISDLHSYDTPCVVFWDIKDGVADYLDWISSAVK